MDSPVFEIEHASQWRLFLHLDDAALTAVFVHTESDTTPHILRIPLPEGVTLASLEEAVYANPVLLSEFRSVDLVLRSMQFVIMPHDEDSDYASFAAALFVDEKAGEPSLFDERVDSPVESVDLIWSAGDSTIANFFTRTFNNPRVHHHLAPCLQAWGRSERRGNSAAVFAAVTSGPEDLCGTLDFAVYSREGRLQMANSIAIDGADDAVYYLLGAAHASGLGASEVVYILHGTPGARSALMQALRPFASEVHPALPFRGSAFSDEIPLAVCFGMAMR